MCVGIINQTILPTFWILWQAHSNCVALTLSCPPCSLLNVTSKQILSASGQNEKRCMRGLRVIKYCQVCGGDHMLWVSLGLQTYKTASTMYSHTLLKILFKIIETSLKKLMEINEVMGNFI